MSNKPSRLIKCAEKSVYGRTLIYPIDADQTKLLFVLTKKITLDDKDIMALEGLGFKIEIERLPR